MFGTLGQLRQQAAGGSQTDRVRRVAIVLSWACIVVAALPLRAQVVPGDPPTKKAPNGVSPHRQVPPRLKNVVAPSSMVFDSEASVSFDYRTGSAKITQLLVNLTNAKGTHTARVPADYVGIVDKSGSGMLPLRAKEMTLGANDYTIQLLAGDFAKSDPASFTIVLEGSTGSGTAPTLDTFDCTAPLWNLPANVSYMPDGSGQRNRLTPTFHLHYADPDADIYRAILKWTDPLGAQTYSELTAGTVGLVDPEGETETTFFNIRPDAPLGTYTVELTLVDRSGQSSETRTAAFIVAEQGGEPTPEIVTIDPTLGGAGTVVTITGSGFDPRGVGFVEVTLAQMPCEVLSANDSEIQVAIPSDTSTGKFMVQTARGLAVAPIFFDVPTAVTIQPGAADRPHVVVGGSLQFSASAVSHFNPQMVWSVGGQIGGNDLVGHVTQDGLYTAPDDIPLGARIAVRAALMDASDIYDEVEVSLEPPTPPSAGSVVALPSAGGTAISEIGRAGLIVPPGAVSQRTTLTVRELYGPSAPAPEPGHRVLGAVTLGPDGQVFTQPVEVILPLARYFAPGTVLSAALFDPDTGTYDRSEGLTATVREDGASASVMVMHFSTYAIDERLPAVSYLPPVIASISPTSGLEGSWLAVHILGSELYADLTFEVLDDQYRPTSDVYASTLFVAGTEAGLDLSLRPSSLPAGSTRDYIIRLSRLDRFGNPLTAEVRFTVVGLNELVIEQELFDPPDYNELFSCVTIKAPVHGSFGCWSMGPIDILAPILASGADGADANGREPGVNPPGSKGADGGRGSDGDDSWGMNAVPCSEGPYPRHNPRGPICQYEVGSWYGQGGVSAEDQDNITAGDIVDTVKDFFECVFTFGLACGSFVGDVLEIVDAATEDDDVAVGGTGAGGLWGGGGGGGGGGATVDYIPGGGGGAGGSPAGGVAINSADIITINQDIYPSAGFYLTGGNGGKGATTLELTESNFFQTLFDLVWNGLGAHSFAITHFPNSGGGGGGASGGTYFIKAGRGLVGVNGTTIHAGGGQHGAGGVYLFDKDNNRHFTMRLNSKFSPGGHNEGRSFAVYPRDYPITNWTDVQNGVYTRSVLKLKFRPNYGRYDFDHVVELPVTCEETGHTDNYRFILDTIESEHYISLCHGFNTLGVRSDPSFYDEVFTKHLLVLFVDSDGDGLDDASEAAFGTDPLKKDTDGDGWSDLTEILKGTNPLKPDADDDGLRDPDDPCPNDPDCDHDGVWDGVEVVLGTSPLSSTSTPSAMPPGKLVAQGVKHVFLIDTATGRAATIGPELSVADFGASYDDTGVLYAVLQTDLVSVNDLTGATMTVGSLGGIHCAKLAYCAADGFLYGVEYDDVLKDHTGQLLRIDKSTGVATRVGAPLTDSIQAIAGDGGTTLRALLKDANGAFRLVELDRTTGQISLEVASTGLTNLHGLANGESGFVASQVQPTGFQTQLLSYDETSQTFTPLAQVEDRALSDLTVRPCPFPCIEQSGPFSVGTRPVRMAVADFDRDGNIDVATCNDLAASISLFRGLGDGTFGPKVTLATHASPVHVAAADLNGDAASDIVVACKDANAVDVFLNDGVGGFTRSVFTAGNGPVWVTVGQFNTNTDSFVDIAAYTNSPARIHIYLGDGQGHFTETTSISDSNIRFPDAIIGVDHLGNDLDFNGDGKGDLAATDFGYSSILVFLGDGNGAFSHGGTVDGISPINPIAGDINNDHIVDLVGPDYYNPVDLGFGAGDGTFYSSQIPDPVYGSSAGIADFDGDGYADLVIGGFYDGLLWMYRGNGIGGFTKARGSPGPSYGDRLMVGDFNNDGRPDLVTLDRTGFNLNVLINRAPY